MVQSALHYTHWPTLVMGVLALAIMVVSRMAPRIPNVLVAVVVTTLISWGSARAQLDRGRRHPLPK